MQWPSPQRAKPLLQELGHLARRQIVCLAAEVAVHLGRLLLVHHVAQGLLPQSGHGAGSALGVDSAVSLAFDPEGFKSSPLLPLRLVAAEGGSLSGTWSFDMPQPRRGRWYVMPVFAGGGVSAYALRFSPPGMKLTIR